jgi:hypothetical protein
VGYRGELGARHVASGGGGVRTPDLERHEDDPRHAHRDEMESIRDLTPARPRHRRRAPAP